MALDYSKLTDEQLQAIADKDYSKLPDDVLLHLADEHDVSENKNVQLSEEALAARNDPLNTALAGAIAGGAAGVSSKGIKLVKALENLAPEKGLVEPVAPTAPPKEYFAPGEKYSAKTGYGSGPGQSVEEVVEHKKAQQAPLGSGKITSKMRGPTSPDEILAAAAQREADDKMRARVLAQEKLLHDQAQAEYATKQQEYLKQKNALAQEKKFGLPNKLGTTKAVTGATLGYNAMDLANQLKQDDYGQAALAGTGMLGAAAPYIKKLPPKYRALGTSLSLLAPAINRGVDVVEQKAVGGAVQHYATGGSLQDMGSAFGGAYPGALTMGGYMSPIDPAPVPSNPYVYPGSGGMGDTIGAAQIPQVASPISFTMAPVDPVATPNPQDVVAMTPETPMTQNPNGSWSPTVNPTGPVNYSAPTPATGGGLSSLIPAKPVVNPLVPKPVIQNLVNPVPKPVVQTQVAQAVRPRIKGATPSGFFNLRKGFHLR